MKGLYLHAITGELASLLSTEAAVGFFAGDGNSSLITLEIISCGLTTLHPGIFDGLRKLINLDLNRNGLETVDVALFTGGLESMDTLNLHGNQLNYLPPGIFDVLPKITSLRLDWNNFTSFLPGVFGPSLVTLLDLKLMGNYLTEITKAVYPQENLISLTVIKFSLNNISYCENGTFDDTILVRGTSLCNNRWTLALVEDDYLSYQDYLASLE